MNTLLNISGTYLMAICLAVKHFKAKPVLNSHIIFWHTLLFVTFPYIFGALYVAGLYKCMTHKKASKKEVVSC